MSRVAQPNVAAQQPDPRRGQKARFRRQLAVLFQSIIKIARQFFLKKNHKLACGQTIFRPAKTKNVRAALPRDRFRRATERRDSIGETRAVHMNKTGALMGEVGERPNLVHRVNGAELGGLSDADYARFLRV